MVFSKVSWLERGLSQISTYVHPGFYGPLRETLVNQSNKTVELDHGSAFCQIVFLDVPEAKADERYMGNRRNQKPEELEKIRWGPNPRVLERYVSREETQNLGSLLKLTAKADPVLAEIWDNERDAAYDRL